MGKWATMDTIWSRFRPWLSCEDICWLNTPPNGRHSQHSAVILLMEPLDNQGTFVPCAARILWYSADKTSLRQLRDTTQNENCQQFSFWLSPGFATSPGVRLRL